MSDMTNEREAAVVAFDNDMRDRDVNIAIRAHRLDGFEKGYEAAKRLVSEPTDEQIKRAAAAAHKFDSEVSEMFGRPFDPDMESLPQWAYDTHLDKARAALKAAGVTPQVVSEPLDTDAIAARIADEFVEDKGTRVRYATMPVLEAIRSTMTEDIAAAIRAQGEATANG